MHWASCLVLPLSSASQSCPCDRMERSDVYDGSEASCLKPEREEDLVDFSALISDLVSLHAKLLVETRAGILYDGMRCWSIYTLSVFGRLSKTLSTIPKVRAS